MAYTTIVLISFVFILIADIIVRINSFVGVSNGSTELVALCNFISAAGLLVLYFKFHWKDKMPHKALLIFKLFMAWSLFEFVRGGFNANDYWDWKHLLLSYSFSILIPLAIVAGLNYEVNVKTFRFILNKLFLFGFLFIPLARVTDYELYARVVMAVSWFILFVPYLRLRWRVLIFIVAGISIAMDVSYRVNVLRILFPIILLFIYLNRRLIKIRTLNLCASILFCLPMVLLSLGVNGQFNVFKENVFDFDMSVVRGGYVAETNISDDTRTFLYEEVFYSMLKRDSSFLIGEGGVAGYETQFFANVESFVLNERGRYGSEVGFLNAILYSGTVGVLLYALMLVVSAFYGINRSKNYLCKMLGIFLAFHWVIFFIEDITAFNMNFYCIWLAIGLCLSNKFRGLTDIEIKQFFTLNCKQAARSVGNYNGPRIIGQFQ